MKRGLNYWLCAALAVPAVALAGNCGVGVGGGVGNPHCSGGPKAPLTQQGGIQPPQSGNPPTQTGGIVPDVHNTVLTPVPTPPDPPQQRTPSLANVPTPPQLLPQQQTPMVVPPDPPQQRTPSLANVPTPPQVLPPQQAPMLVPPEPRQQRTPALANVPTPPQVLPPQATPIIVPPDPPQQRTPALAGFAIPPRPGLAQVLATGSGGVHLVPGEGHGHVLLPLASGAPAPVTSGRHAIDGIYSLEFIEPGLQNRKVKVYRARDAAEQVYRDTIPLDRGGFQLIIIGTRNPSYAH